MLIRSQSKLRLVEFNRPLCVQMEKGNNYSIYMYVSDCYFNLGTYSSEAKAIKVLDMIQEEYKASLMTRYYDNGYSCSRTPYQVVNNIVFEMPLDENVKID